jgi:hypothetical protein
METNKIISLRYQLVIGYALLLIGILLIVLPLWQTYNVFTGKSVPAQVFAKPIALQVDEKVSPLDIQKQMQNAFIKILPIDLINNTLNLICWLVLMWILIYGGGRIAEIGVKLLNGTK